jgi:predicted transcriptional regulator
VTTKELLDKIASWPPEDQEELAQYAREIEARRIGVYRLSEVEQQGIERGLKAMREGKFASDERVAAILKNARSSHT